MYLIDKDAEFTTVQLGKIIQQFQTRDLPRLNKYYNYYKGKQAITRKKATDTGKPCNKVVVNYCYNIVQNYLGYMTGVSVDYTHEDNIDDLLDILNYNDVKSEDSEYLRNALIFGRAFEMNYIDDDKKQRFRVLDSRQCIPVYDNTLNNDLRLVVRFWKEDLIDKHSESYIVEVYDDKYRTKYRSTMGFTSFELLEKEPHYFSQCPITPFMLDEEEDPIFMQIMTLQDAYNELISGEVDDFDSFCDAYLVLQGTTADDQDIEDMKKKRVLIMDEDADAHYLTKSVSDTQIENMLTNINDQIHKIANSPDFNDEKFMAQSGVAMRYKLVGFENKASDIESHMKKALQRRIELIYNILRLTEGEEMWRDINITFHRNLPEDIADIANTVGQFRGLVSTKTLLSQIPFVSNVDDELKEVEREQKESMSLYRFDFNNKVDKEDDKQ